MIGFAIMGAVNWITKWFDPAGPMSSDEIGQRSPTTWSADCCVTSRGAKAPRYASI